MDGQTLTLLVGMSLVTFLPRMLPVVVLSRVNLPPVVRRWLTYIPVAVLASLLASVLLLKDGRPALELTDPALLAALPCFLVALRWRNLAFTVVVGVTVMCFLVWLGIP